MMTEKHVEIAGDELSGVHMAAEAGDFWPEVEKILQEVAGLTFSRSIGEIAPDTVGRLKYIVVAAESEAGALRFLQTIRGNLIFGLLPVVLAMPTAPERLSAPYYDALAISPFSPYQIKKVLLAQRHILTRMAAYPPWQEIFDEQAQREIQLLRFLDSRGPAAAVPQRDPESPVGYSIPWAEAVMPGNRGSSIRLMNRYAQEGLLVTELLDRVNLCPQCGDYRLNIREVCPVCGSPDIRKEKTIQHFPCAHIAPESYFTQEDQYICPKCHKTLKHIGVDYAKPGDVVVCNQCGEFAAEPATSFICLVCGLAAAPENLHQIAVQRYRLSPLGQRAAVEGLHIRSSLNDVLKSFLNIYDFDFLKKYLQMEVKRALRYKQPFSLIRLAIANAEEVEDSLGLNGKMALIRELETFLGSSIRGTDMISFAPNGEIFILLLGCDAGRAEQVLDRILTKSRGILTTPLYYKHHIICVPEQVRDFDKLLSPGDLETT